MSRSRDSVARIETLDATSGTRHDEPLLGQLVHHAHETVPAWMVAVRANAGPSSLTRTLEDPVSETPAVSGAVAATRHVGRDQRVEW